MVSHEKRHVESQYERKFINSNSQMVLIPGHAKTVISCFENGVDSDQMAFQKTADQVVLFDLILYLPVSNFSVMSGRVFLG